MKYLNFGAKIQIENLWSAVIWLHNFKYFITFT